MLNRPIIGTLMSISAAAALALGLGACSNTASSQAGTPSSSGTSSSGTSSSGTSSSGTSSSGTSSSSGASPSETSSLPSGASAIPSDQLSPAGTLGTKPTVVVPSGPPPSQLEVADLIPGNGPAVVPGATVTAQYVGVSWTTGKQFDASWDHPGAQPVQFLLSGVIQGWAEGLVGMKVGGRRELIIPPSLGYGSSPPPGSGIPPNDTLIFVVDLVSSP